MPYARWAERIPDDSIFCGAQNPREVAHLIADSVLFLYLAFGSLEFLEGQIVGKAWMVLLALPIVHWIRKREGVGAVADCGYGAVTKLQPLLRGR